MEGEKEIERDRRQAEVVAGSGTQGDVMGTSDLF